MEIRNANTELILGKIADLSAKISELPSKNDVKLAVIEGIQTHEDRCKARNLPIKVAENTATIKSLTNRRLRNSMAPAARMVVRLPIWIKILIPAAITATLSFLGLSS